MEDFLQSALGSPAARSKSLAPAAAPTAAGKGQMRDKENRTPPRKLLSERTKPAQLPQTPGRTATLRSIVLEATAKEDAGDADGALAAYMAALKIVPGEPRILRRVAAVESQARGARAGGGGGGLSARPALDNNNNKKGSGGADLLHDALRGVTMPSSVRKLAPCGSAVAAAVADASAGPPPPPPRSPLSRAVAVIEDDEDEAFEHPVADPPQTPEKSSAEVSSATGGRMTSPGAAAAAAGERSAGGGAGNREMRAALERQVVDILNTAPVEELMALHGVGVVRAQRIVAARRDDGPFVDLSDLSRIGLYDKQIQRLARQNVLERLDLP